MKTIQPVYGLNPTPYTPSATQVNTISSVKQVLTAPLDTILSNDKDLEIEILTRLIFEKISGQEIINIARTDTVNGQNVSYQPIKNLFLIQQQYNPTNIINLQATSDKYFKNFIIKLEEKIPNVGSGPNGEFIYIDPQTGDLVIDLVNILEGEQIQVEIITTGVVYEAEL
jgi:hypothetical protein